MMARKRKRAATAVVPYVAKAAVGTVGRDAATPVSDSGWSSVWMGGYTPWQLTQGFQLDIDYRSPSFQANWVVFACQTLIASDIGKLGIGLTELQQGVWQATTSPAYSRLLRKPNDYQTWQQFAEVWSYSKQRRGNTYVLMERDLAERARALYVLNPDLVTPLLAPDGSVYYRLQADDLAGLPEQVVVPASEIMHDRFNCIFHWLVGLPPLFAGALAASGGITMQEQAQKFFRNGSRPGGLLTTPGVLTNADMKKYKAEWEANFSGENAGRTAVLGNGLKYEVIKETAVDSEIVALSKLNAEAICSVHHVPPFKVGVGGVPIQSTADVMNQVYYDNCLQTLLEAIEALLDDGLGLHDVDGRNLRSQFDLRDLIRMDRGKLVDTLTKEVGGGITAPNEARAELGRGPKIGGDSPMMQQQNYSLSALDKRDRDDPFAKPAPAAAPAPAANDDEADAEEAAEKFLAKVATRLLEVQHAG